MFLKRHRTLSNRSVFSLVLPDTSPWYQTSQTQIHFLKIFRLTVQKENYSPKQKQTTTKLTSKPAKQTHLYFSKGTKKHTDG